MHRPGSRLTLSRGLVGLVGLVGLAQTGCGITGRHALGPTLDTDGRVGILYTVSVGPMVGCARKIAVPVRAGIGATSAGLDSAHRVLELGVGVDWIPEIAHRAGEPLVDAAAPATPAASGAGAPTPATTSDFALGKRLSLHAGYLQHGDAEALALGLSGALTVPLQRRHMSLGLEAGCDALAVMLSDDGPSARCRLSLLLDLSNTHAFHSDTYY